MYTLSLHSALQILCCVVCVCVCVCVRWICDQSHYESQTTFTQGSSSADSQIKTDSGIMCHEAAAAAGHCIICFICVYVCVSFEMEGGDFPDEICDTLETEFFSLHVI